MRNKCKPYKEAQVWDITQEFSPDHDGVDFAFKRSTFLVAVETERIKRIITTENFDDTLTDLRRGYGILSTSLDKQRKYLRWHCMPIFPVKEGDIVRQGEILAQMSNSGLVKSNGKIVPLKDRLKSPYKGVHTHFMMWDKGELVNYFDYIGWLIPIRYDIWSILRAAKLVALNILELLKRS